VRSLHSEERRVTVPPHTTAIPIRVANELVGQVVGKTIYCAWFRIESLGDGTYEMTVSRDSADVTLDHLEHGTLWEGPS